MNNMKVSSIFESAELAKLLVEGLVKKANKAAKKEFTKKIGGQIGRPGVVQGRNKLQGKGYNDRRDSHTASRGKKTKGVLETALVEGLTKKINKAKKNAALDAQGRSIQNTRKGTYPDDKYEHPRTAARDANKKNITNTKHAALNVAGEFRRGGNKSLAKTFLKASKPYKESLESFKKGLVLAVSKILVEGRDDSDTDADSITNAGGDANTYAKIKAAKSAKGSEKPKHTRRDTLGRAKGPVKGGKDNFRKGDVKKPLPLKIKGKAAPGKKVQGVRGVAVNTSRGTGREGDKAEKNNAAFNKLVTGLMRSKKQ